MTTDNQTPNDAYPAYPVKAPGQNDYAYRAALVEHEKAGAAWFERNGSRPAAPASVQQPPTPAEAEERVAEFDREMRAAGNQRNDTYTPGEVDQRALQFLENAMKTKPAAERTSAWLTVWERDYASVLEGRRYGETPEAFAARKSGVTQDAPTAAEVDAVGVDSSHFTTEEHGYTLPPLPDGVELDRDVTAGMLNVARAAGIPQRLVDAYFHQLMRQT